MSGRLLSTMALAFLGACGGVREDVAPTPDSASGVVDAAPETAGPDGLADASDEAPPETGADAPVLDAPSDAEASPPDAPPAEAPPVYPELGKACTSDAECGKGTCQSFGAAGTVCTLPCKVAADCPVGSEGQKCNLKGFCRP